MNQSEARQRAAELGGVATYESRTSAASLPSKEWVVIDTNEKGEWVVVEK